MESSCKKLLALIIRCLHEPTRNVTGLKWSQVDLVARKAWIHPDQAKARKAIAVPLSSAAVVLLRQQLDKKREDKYREYVLVYHGKPVTPVNGKAWKGALDRGAAPPAAVGAPSGELCGPRVGTSANGCR